MLINQITFILSLVNFALILGIIGFLFFAYSRYQLLTRDINQKDLSSVLAKIRQELTSLTKAHQSQQDELTALTPHLEPYFKKLGFVRYNPFGNTGGDQSFCLTLLDGRDNGILITSLHSREQTRLYTKVIVAGQPADNAKLSKEELSCLKTAQKWSKS